MKQFQTAIVRLRGRAREDEESLTDMLNERARMGWMLHSISPLGAQKLLIVFQREA